MSRPHTVLAMAPDLPSRLFVGAVYNRLCAIAVVDPDLVLTEFGSPAARAALADAELLLTGWNCPPVDEVTLAAAPRLRALVHAGGSIKEHVTPACWERGIVVSTSAEANALPVAEFTLAMILLAGKATHLIARRYRQEQTALDLRTEFPDIGNYHRTVGIVGASRIGRRVIELLRPFDLEVVVSDPYLEQSAAHQLGVKLVDLDDMLRASHTVSVHAPALPSTRHLIDRRRLGLMTDGATLINTARGALVDQAALTDELMSGRINAILDVTEPWVLPADSPLYTLPNVVLTPHMAGALGVELRRIGAYAVDELARYAAGQPFRSPVTRADLDRMA
jgi:phosphoglycerate dehydrogenase-like enzyme